MTDHVEAVVFDVGRVLYQWQLSALFEKLIELVECHRGHAALMLFAIAIDVEITKTGDLRPAF